MHEGKYIDDNDLMYIHKEVIKMGTNAFSYYNGLYAGQESCKDFIKEPTAQYEDCMVEKANCCYEETIRLFKQIGEMKQQLGLEEVVNKEV